MRSPAACPRRSGHRPAASRHAVIFSHAAAGRGGLAVPGRGGPGLALAGLALAGLALAGCSGSGPGAPAPPPSSSSAAAPGTHPAQALASPSPSVTPSPTPTCTGIAPGFSCVMQRRITEAQRYVAGRHGSIGIVLDDRVTGSVWHNARAHALVPAASTMKLAVLADLLLRNRRGSIHLTPGDFREMYQALHTSNDDDANDLWRKYENGSFLPGSGRSG